MATQRSVTPPGFYDPQPPTKNGRLPAQIRKIELPQLSDHPIFIALFENVTNAAFLRQQLLVGNPEFDYCFIDARMILSPKQVFLASFLAINAYKSDTMKTRTAHSEILFRLHPNRNIGEALRTFGIKDDSQHIIVVKIGNLRGEPPADYERVARHLGEEVLGTDMDPLPAGEYLGVFQDGRLIKRTYRLVQGNGDRTEMEELEMETEILGIMSVSGN